MFTLENQFVNIKSHLKLNFNDFIQLPSAFGKSNYPFDPRPAPLIKEYIVFNFIAYIRCEITRFFSEMHKNKLQQMVEN